MVYVRLVSFPFVFIFIFIFRGLGSSCQDPITIKATELPTFLKRLQLYFFPFHKCVLNTIRNRLVLEFLCFSFAESAFLSIDETDFFKEVVCWYSSMKKFKIESYKFCALCTLKSHLINLFPVNFLFSCECGVFLPLLLTVVGWFAFS